MAPQLELNIAFSTNPSVYNYCKIPTFGRYYWIKNWTYVGRLWVASCEVDVLATYRAPIRSSTQYVLRSASRSNGKLTDTLYPLLNDYTFQKHALDFHYKYTLNTGTYILGIINGDSNSVGCVSYYYMSQTEIDNLKAYLLEPVAGSTLSAFLTDIMQTVTDISEGSLKALYNPLQYIASCYWVPFQLWHDTPPAGAAVTDLPFGWWTLTGITAERVLGEFLHIASADCILGHHPQESRGAYMNAAPYTELIAYVQPFGSIPLDPAMLRCREEGLINFYQYLDLVTCESILTVTAYIDETFVYLTAPIKTQLGIPIQLSQVSMNMLNDWKSTAVALGGDAISGALGAGLEGSNTRVTLGDVIMGRGSLGEAFKSSWNYYMQGLDRMTGGGVSKAAGAASNIASAARASMTQMMTTGVNGNMATFQLQCYLLEIHYKVADDDNSHRGRPLCAKVQLSNLSGYVLIADPDIALAAPDAEIDMIKNFMITGMYLE